MSKGLDSQLFAAASSGALLKTKQLLSRGANPNHANNKNTGATCLMRACAGGHSTIARTLINGGADLDLQDNNGGTALDYAVRHGHAEAAKLLLEQGARRPPAPGTAAGSPPPGVAFHPSVDEKQKAAILTLLLMGHGDVHTATSSEQQKPVKSQSQPQPSTPAAPHKLAPQGPLQKSGKNVEDASGSTPPSRRQSSLTPGAIVRKLLCSANEDILMVEEKQRILTFSGGTDCRPAGAAGAAAAAAAAEALRLPVPQVPLRRRGSGGGGGGGGGAGGGGRGDDGRLVGGVEADIIKPRRRASTEADFWKGGSDDNGVAQLPQMRPAVPLHTPLKTSYGSSYHPPSPSGFAARARIANMTASREPPPPDADTPPPKTSRWGERRPAPKTALAATSPTGGIPPMLSFDFEAQGAMTDGRKQITQPISSEQSHVRCMEDSRGSGGQRSRSNSTVSSLFGGLNLMPLSRQNSPGGDSRSTSERPSSLVRISSISVECNPPSDPMENDQKHHKSLSVTGLDLSSNLAEKMRNSGPAVLQRAASDSHRRSAAAAAAAGAPGRRRQLDRRQNWVEPGVLRVLGDDPRESEDSPWDHDSIYEISAMTIDGERICLEIFRPYPVWVVVNVASQCGFAHRNYPQLARLRQKYHDRGLEILAFPCNQFAQQEPWHNERIKEYVQSKYKASFPLFAKTMVNGSDQHPLYSFLKKKLEVENILWNFTKFLVVNGAPTKMYTHNMSPQSLENEIDTVFDLLERQRKAASVSPPTFY